MRWWDPATGDPAGDPLTGHTDPVEGVAFSPDGRRCWPRRAGTARCGCGTRAPATSAASSSPATPTRCMGWRSAPTADLLATAGGDGTVRLWDPHTGDPAGDLLAGHDRGVNAVAFSPDGDLLATAELGRHGAVVGPRHRPTRWATRLHRHAEGVHAVAFSPDGDLLATGDWRPHGAVVGPALRRPGRRPPHRPRQNCLWGGVQPRRGACSPARSLDGTVRLWDPAPATRSATRSPATPTA